MAENDRDRAAAAGEDTAGTAAARRRRIKRQAYYSIGDVCSMLDLKPHVLRYWETQFGELSPTKNRAGNRVYRPEDIELISLIKRLVHDERYTVEGARMRLDELRESGEADAESERAMERSFLRTVTNELQELYELLSPSERH